MNLRRMGVSNRARDCFDDGRKEIVMGKGFASLDDDTKKDFAKKGGLASAMSNKTSNRGFASMEKEKLREISRLGGKRSSEMKYGRPDEDEEQEGSDDLTSLEEEDEIESPDDNERDLSYSETDEDEDEGLGDGNLSRSAT
jgi:general stress protein YciG